MFVNYSHEDILCLFCLFFVNYSREDVVCLFCCQKLPMVGQWLRRCSCQLVQLPFSFIFLIFFLFVGFFSSACSFLDLFVIQLIDCSVCCHRLLMVGQLPACPFSVISFFFFFLVFLQQVADGSYQHFQFQFSVICLLSSFSFVSVCFAATNCRWLGGG